MLTCPICGEPIAKPNSCVFIDPALKTHVDALYTYQVDAMPPFLERIRAADRRVVQKHLRGYQSVLEIGAANGWLTRQLSDHDVLALDYSAHPITGLGAKGAWHTIQMDLTDLSIFAPGTFDAVIVNHGLHLFPQPVAYVRQALTLLRPGGVIILLNLIFHRDPQKRMEQLHRQSKAYEATHSLPFLIKPSRGYLDFHDHAQLKAMGFAIKPYRVMWRSRLKACVKPTAPRYCFAVLYWSGRFAR